MNAVQQLFSITPVLLGSLQATCPYYCSMCP